jgi:hypothetical protein
MDQLHEIVPPPEEMEKEFLASSPSKMCAMTSSKEEIPPTQPLNEIPILEEKSIKSAKSIKSISLEQDSQKLRKSQRMLNRNTEIELNVINCHQCKKIEVTKNILTCGNDECRDSFCYGCVQKYFVCLLTY